jgi:hypothetical protein
MSKQNLVNLARHSNNIVPVPEIRGIYAKVTSPDGTYSLIPTETHPATNRLSKSIAEFANEKYWLFNTADTYLNGILEEDILLRITNLGEAAITLNVIKWTPTLVKKVTCSSVDNDDYITIGDIKYTFKSTLSTEPTVANEVLLGNGGTEAAANLNTAINAGDGIGTNYSTGTTVNLKVTSAVSGADLTISAIASSSLPEKKLVGIGEQIELIPSNIAELIIEPTIAGDTLNKQLRTMVKWTPSIVGDIIIPVGYPYDLYLPAYGDIYNGTGNKVAVSFAIMR